MAAGLFAGQCARAIRKKSQTIFKQTATASSAQEKARCRKGAALERGFETSKMSPFGSALRAYLPRGRSRAERRHLDFPFLGATGRGAHPPFPLPNG